MFLNCARNTLRNNFTLFKVIFILFFYLKCSLFSINYCFAQTTKQKPDNIKFDLTYSRGETYFLSEDQSHARVKFDCEYYLPNSTSLIIGLSITDIKASKITCSLLENGARTFVVDYFINSKVFHNYYGIINFSIAFGGSYINFVHSNKFDLEGFSSLLSTLVSFKISNLIPYSNYEFWGQNRTKIGIFRGRINHISEQVKFNSSYPHLSIESGFVFPIFKMTYINLSYQNELLGDDISQHSCKIGVILNF